MRLAIAAVVFTGFLLVYGFAKTSEALRFRSPQTMTYDQFHKAKPQEGWFHIKNAQLNVIESSFEKSKTSETIRKAFVPITSAEEMLSDKNEKTYLLMETTDPGIINTVREAGSSITDEKSAIKFVAGDIQRAYPTRDVEGMIKAGLDADSDTRKELTKIDDSLEPNYVILEEGKHPSMAGGIGMLLGGIVLGIAQVLYYGSRMRG